MSAYEALKLEIRRLARKEAKTLIEGSSKSAKASRKQLADLRMEVATLKREVSALKRSVAALEKTSASVPATTGARSRITAKGIVSLRTRLGLSQSELGTLCGVSDAAVSHWEAERSKPRGEGLAKLLELRGLGKKDVAKRLAAIQ